MDKIRADLLNMQDPAYREFHSKLIPNIPKEKIIGVRTPRLREYAKKIRGSAAAERFLTLLPHKFYEENNLHAFLIEDIKDFSVAAKLTEDFLPYIDNWATCDSFLPKAFKKNPGSALNLAQKWINSKETYTVRFGIGIFMKLFLDKNFKEEYLKTVSQIRSDEYYINMMIAWYFQTALVKQYDAAVSYIKNKALPKRVHNKAIQKAVESLRIPNDTKVYLKSLKM